MIHLRCTASGPVRWMTAWAGLASLVTGVVACGGHDAPVAEVGAAAAPGEPAPAAPSLPEPPSPVVPAAVEEVPSEGNAAASDAPLAPPAEPPAPDPAPDPPAAEPPPVPTLDWAPCENGFECADALVPRDYADPNGASYRVAVTRRPASDAARRIGPLFFNFGGPGGNAVQTLQAIGAGGFGPLGERFDLVAVDPRGVGRSEAAIDCGVDQEAEGLYAQPYLTPATLDVDTWTARAEAYVEACIEASGDVAGLVSTGNVARDMDLVRAALGDEQLSYLGFSYGTFLGATYASLFPGNYRAMVLDGAVDADEYINRPSAALRAQSVAFEVALGRFLDACASDGAACFGFGAGDPRAAFDGLVAALDASPLPVPGTGRVLDGADVLMGANGALYDKGSWLVLAAALAELELGAPARLRALADNAYGRRNDGSFEPLSDRYFVLGSAEQSYSSDLEALMALGESAFSESPHFFWNTGYAELPQGLFPVRSNGIYTGPFVAAPEALPILVVATTFDPATPYAGSEQLVESLGNARLLTLVGDGHTAYRGNSPCIDDAVEAYLLDEVLPEAGTECEQAVPFGAVRAGGAAAFVATPELSLGPPGVPLPVRRFLRQQTRSGLDLGGAARGR